MPAITAVDLLHADKSLILISPPWRLSNWPSTALGYLKRYLVVKGVPVRACHLHLTFSHLLGTGRYEAISRGWEAGEALFSALIEPAERESLLAAVTRNPDQYTDHTLINWLQTTAVEDVGAAIRHSIDRLNLSSVGIIGLSVGALQFSAAVYLARCLKQLIPSVTIVAGGSSLVGDVGRNALAAISDFDFVVDGEGEMALYDLYTAFSAGRLHAVGDIPNLWYRDGVGGVLRTQTEVLASLESVGPPDYSDYFLEAERLNYPKIRIVLPVEASRGCAWEHRCASQDLTGCTFCGIYRTSPNYREKPFQQLLTEIKHLIWEYRLLELSFTDAYLPDRYRRELLRALAASRRDVTLFCEMRCNLDDEISVLLARAGARRVQLGVESFSTSILNRIAKGTRAIDNINSMKLCEEYRIPYQYNVITNIPGVMAEEVDAMTSAMPLLYGFRPPDVTKFYLDRGSRMFRDPACCGLDPSTFDCSPITFLPGYLSTRRLTQYVPFHEDDTDDNVAAWFRLEKAVDLWRDTYTRNVREGFPYPLTYRDGDDFILISDCRSGSPRLLTLDGDVRRVFMACDRVTSIHHVYENVSDKTIQRVDQVLLALIAENLVYREGDNVLALPIRTPLPSGADRLRSKVSHKSLLYRDLCGTRDSTL